MELRHLGIICDGNRRWAKERGLPTLEGNNKGLAVIEDLVNAAMDAKIPYVSFYVFSTENWNRTEKEVTYLMKLADRHIMRLAEKMVQQNGKLLVLGTKDRVPPRLVSTIEKAEKMTAGCDGITVCFCFNYGGKQEIADAATIASKVEGEITPETIRKHLYHPEVPDVDMIVRTSGEERISGFMLWRGAYSELMFIEKDFPAMEPSDIPKIIAEYNRRSRRFGK
mgnify:CR=1 FL=1